MQTDTTRLHHGAHIRCPHCGHCHPVAHGHTQGTDYTLQMLYFTCRGLRYYAGQAGRRADIRCERLNPLAPAMIRR